jgi:hypothetical protein
LKIRGIATPACALVRNDGAFSNSPFFKIPLQILSPADIINITFERGRGHGG